AVAVPAEGQDDAVVALALAVHAVTDAAVGEEVDGALFQDAGAGRVLDLATGAQVDGDGLDPGAGQQMAEHEPGGTCPDHGDLRTAVDDRCGGGGRGEGHGPRGRARRPACAPTSDTSRRTRLRRPRRPPSSSGGPGRQRVRPGGLMPRVTDGYAEALGARTARPALTGRAGRRAGAGRGGAGGSRGGPAARAPRRCRGPPPRPCAPCRVSLA